jgi:hypothetical protein
MDMVYRSVRFCGCCQCVGPKCYFEPESKKEDQIGAYDFLLPRLVMIRSLSSNPCSSCTCTVLGVTIYLPYDTASHKLILGFAQVENVHTIASC